MNPQMTQMTLDTTRRFAAIAGETRGVESWVTQIRVARPEPRP